MGTALRGDAAVDGVQERMDESVLGAGCILELELDVAVDARHPAHEHRGCAAAEFVAALIATHGQGVDERDRARRGPERGLQQHRLVDVAATDLGVTRGTDRPVAGALVEDATEHRRAVEAREAQPVDRAVLADQGGRLAIGQQCVLCDG